MAMGIATKVLTRYPHQARFRAIVKTLLYRLFMIMITVTVAWLVTGSGIDAISIGLVTNLLKTGTYYAYERAWDHVAWGVSSAN